jgi:nicotinamidase-related amidase
MDRYIGFYWTLPVPTHGFVKLPDDVDEAAARSRTIRYQRDQVRRWVGEERGILVHEEVFLELDPDHGTDHIVRVVDKLLDRCRHEQAQLVIVSIWDLQDLNWRRHHRLLQRIQAGEASGLCLALEPDQHAPESKKLISNFEYWRKVREEFTQGKAGREHLLYQTIQSLKENGGAKASSEVLARALNAADIRTPNNRSWTAGNLRQFMRRYMQEAEDLASQPVIEPKSS